MTDAGEETKAPSGMKDTVQYTLIPFMMTPMSILRMTRLRILILIFLKRLQKGFY